MKAFRTFFIVSLCSLLLLASCHKGEFSVSQVMAQPYIVSSDSPGTFDMGLSLYVSASVPSLDGMSMVVTDPSSNLTWSFAPSSVQYDGTTCYGTSDIMMPHGSMLPEGSWNLEILYKDGRTLDLSFDVSYRDVEGALERAEELPAFDSISNLTVL